MRCENIVMVPDTVVLGGGGVKKGESKSQSYTGSQLFSQKETQLVSKPV